MKILKILILICIIALGIGYYNYSTFKNTILTKEEKIISITSEDTFYNLNEKINSINSFWLKTYLKLNSPEFDLQSGRYKIEANSNIEEIITSLKEPIPDEEISLTILEGWNIYDIDEYLTNQGLISSGEYISYVTNEEKIEKLSEFFPFLKGLKTLEGFLYPDTYTLSLNNFEVRKLVLDKQLSAFEEKVYNKLLKDLNNKEIEKLINLASIVEKEEKIKENKAIVTGILKKRLDENWMLGADATVCYSYELTSEQCKMVVTKYIGEKNEYNTRTMTGLPKTPISNPSIETIEATLNYKNSPYYYYLHDNSGEIHYGITNEDHNNNKNKYIK